MTPSISILTTFGVTVLVGYYAGQGARRVRLPSLVGYMVLGILIGPSFLDLLDEAALQQSSFITSIALGLVAFSIGSELSLSSLRRLGAGIVSIILAESLAAFALVTVSIYLVTGNLPLSLVFGAIAPASAPAGTVAVIQEYRARGNLTKALYAVVGFDDGLAILIFGFSAALAKSLLVDKALTAQQTATGAARASGESIVAALQAPAVEIVLSLVVGAILGLIYCQLARRLKSSRDHLVIVLGMVLLASGLAIQWHLSLILTNMMVGFVLVNTRHSTLVERATHSLVGVMPFVFILFFALAGAHLDISKLPALGLLGIVYIAARTGGLMGGSRLGALIGGVEDNVKRYIGLGILSQAGVAIGLALIIRQEFANLAEKYPVAFEHLTSVAPDFDPIQMGAAIITTVTATCVVFEIVGPVLTKVALTRAGEIPDHA